MKGVKRVANKGKARSLDNGMVIEERRLARVERRAHSRQQWKPRLSRVEKTEGSNGQARERVLDSISGHQRLLNIEGRAKMGVLRQFIWCRAECMGRKGCASTEGGCGEGTPMVRAERLHPGCLLNRVNHGQNTSLKLFPSKPNEQDKPCCVHLAAREDRIKGSDC